MLRVLVQKVLGLALLLLGCMGCAVARRGREKPILAPSGIIGRLCAEESQTEKLKIVWDKGIGIETCKVYGEGEIVCEGTLEVFEVPRLVVRECKDEPK